MAEHSNSSEVPKLSRQEARVIRDPPPRDPIPTDSRWQIGDRIKDRWEVHKIVQTGMSSVYIVYDHKRHEPFAAKTFRDDILNFAPATAERFTREALAWIRLDAHQNVARARFVEKIYGKPFLFLEFVSGGDLSGWIGTPRLTEDLPQVLRFAIQFCDGMMHAYSKGIGVHRDVKPQNCLITEDGTLKVADFGLAKVLDGVERGAHRMPCESRPDRCDLTIGETASGLIAGTPHYMAPEQFDGKDVDVRADIYSFGVMLFQMITGKLPFAGPAWKDFERQHTTKMPSLLAISHSRLSALIQTCLAKDPSRRFEHFGVVRDQLAEIYTTLAGQPAPEPEIGASPSTLYLLSKARSLLLSRSPDEGANYLDRALELDPRYDWAWAGKGAVLEDLGRREEALRCFDRALELNPRRAVVWLAKGTTLAKLGRTSEALDCLDRALELNPRHPEAWLNKGLMLRKLGKHQEALNCYDSALDLNPRQEDAWRAKGTVLADIGKLAEALLCFDRALELNPQREETWRGKGGTLALLGRSAEALSCFDSALHLNPNSEVTWRAKGCVLTQLNRQTEALACYERALELNPRSEGAWYMRGAVSAVYWNCTRTGDFHGMPREQH